jgi:hypothetical protein
MPDLDVRSAFDSQKKLHLNRNLFMSPQQGGSMNQIKKMKKKRSKEFPIRDIDSFAAHTR